MFLNEFKIKEQICEIGRRVYNKGFAAANDGNISVRLNDKEIMCTPTMISKGFMKPEDLCKVDYEGKQIAGTRKRSSEILLHLSVYKHRPDVHAVVHCHPPHATAFAVAHEPIPKCILPEVEVFLGEVPIAVYETPGGQKFAETIVPYLKDCNTILLANHGTITFGPTLEKAYWNSGDHRRLLQYPDPVQATRPRQFLFRRPDQGTPGVQEEAGLRRPTPAHGKRRYVRQQRLRSRLQRFRSQGSRICEGRRRFVRRHMPHGPTEIKDVDELVRIVTDKVMAALAESRA